MFAGITVGSHWGKQYRVMSWLSAGEEDLRRALHASEAWPLLEIWLRRESSRRDRCDLYCECVFGFSGDFTRMSDDEICGEIGRGLLSGALVVVAERERRGGGLPHMRTLPAASSLELVEARDSDVAEPVWIELVLTDAAGKPCARTRCTLSADKGATIEGVTDDQGFVRIENVPHNGAWKVAVEPIPLA